MTEAGLTIPDYPVTSDDEWDDAVRRNDFAAIFFDRYRFVGHVCNLIACIKRESPSHKPVPRVQHHVLIGHLNRCARLMLANVALSHEGLFGETTAIVDRCIFETAVRIVWFCQEPNEQKFERYLASSLAIDLEFRAQIENEIRERGTKIPIEDRMLKSIERHRAAAEMSEDEVSRTKRMPTFENIMKEIGLNRLQYTIAHKFGSGHVHGSWGSLISHYLERESEEEPVKFVPRDHDASMSIDQYVFNSYMVIDALRAFCIFSFDEETGAGFASMFDAVENELRQEYEYATKCMEDYRVKRASASNR